jgi:hypothetical protein
VYRREKTSALNESKCGGRGPPAKDDSKDTQPVMHISVIVTIVFIQGFSRNLLRHDVSHTAFCSNYSNIEVFDWCANHTSFMLLKKMTMNHIRQEFPKPQRKLQYHQKCPNDLRRVEMT